MELAPALLRSARPITNAVAGRAHAPRPDCADVLTSPPSLSFFSLEGQGQTRTVRIVWRLSTTSQLIPCHLRQELALSFLDDGQPVHLQGAGGRVLEGTLPEGMALAPGQLGMEWRWTNWCGGNAEVRLHGAAARGPAGPLGAAGLYRPVQTLEAQGGGVGGVGGAGGLAGRIVG